MKSILNTGGGSHYYTQTGAPRYTMEIKSGKRKGEHRNTSLADARKAGWLPSITTVLGSYPKDRLDEWIKEQAVLARHNNPPPEEAAAPIEKLSDCDEAQKVYFQWIAKLANKIRDEKGARGTYLHDGCEAILKGEPWNEDDAALVALAGWLKENVEEVYFLERSVVNIELGVAGRLDACVKVKGKTTPRILDYKGRGFGHTKARGWEAKRRKSDLLQLAFYASTQADLPVVANLYIANDRDEPLLDYVEYDEDEREAAFDALRHVVKVWQYDNNYRPQIDHDEILEHLEAAQ